LPQRIHDTAQLALAIWWHFDSVKPEPAAGKAEIDAFVIWAKHGWIDYYAPQIYVAEIETLRQRSRRTMKDVSRDMHVYVGIRLRVKQQQDRDLSPAELCDLVKTIRSVGAQGIVLFWGTAFSDVQAEALHSGPFHGSVPLPPPSRSSERSGAEPWTNRR
jgi:uncharacterized lipoprotein YddW (UPF0748 family)